MATEKTEKDEGTKGEPSIRFLKDIPPYKKGDIVRSNQKEWNNVRHRVASRDAEYVREKSKPEDGAGTLPV